jgi:hypothetical protein
MQTPKPFELIKHPVVLVFSNHQVWSQDEFGRNDIAGYGMLQVKRRKPSG